MLNLATKAGVEGRSRLRIHTPLIAASKAAIVRRAPSAWTRAHVKLLRPAARRAPVRRLESCILRRNGFAEVGVADLSFAKSRPSRLATTRALVTSPTRRETGWAVVPGRVRRPHPAIGLATERGGSQCGTDGGRKGR